MIRSSFSRFKEARRALGAYTQPSAEVSVSLAGTAAIAHAAVAQRKSVNQVAQEPRSVIFFPEFVVFFGRPRQTAKEKMMWIGPRA